MPLHVRDTGQERNRSITGAISKKRRPKMDALFAFGTVPGYLRDFLPILSHFDRINSKVEKKLQVLFTVYSGLHCEVPQLHTVLWIDVQVIKNQFLG